MVTALREDTTQPTPRADRTTGELRHPIPDQRQFVGEFMEASDLAEIGERLVHTHARFAHLRTLRIDYLWKRKGGKAKGRNTIGKCQIGATGLLGYYSEKDFVLWLAADHLRERNATRAQVERHVFKQLCVAGVDDETGALTLWAPDFSGFNAEVAEYGADEDLEPVVLQLGLTLR